MNNIENYCDNYIPNPKDSDRLIASFRYLAKGFPDCTKCSGLDYLCPEYTNRRLNIK